MVLSVNGHANSFCTTYCWPLYCSIVEQFPTGGTSRRCKIHSRHSPSDDAFFSHAPPFFPPASRTPSLVGATILRSTLLSNCLVDSSKRRDEAREQQEERESRASRSVGTRIEQGVGRYCLKHENQTILFSKPDGPVSLKPAAVGHHL
jgi:hypothetical protein